MEDIWDKNRPLDLKKISDYFNDIKFSQDDLNNKAALEKLCSATFNTGDVTIADSKTNDGQIVNNETKKTINAPNKIEPKPPIEHTVHLVN